MVHNSIYTCSRTEAELNALLKEWISKRTKNSAHGKGGFFLPRQDKHSCQQCWNRDSKPAVDFSDEDYSLCMSTDFEPSFHLSQLTYPLHKASGNGNIVFISSAAGLVTVQYTALYARTTGAMNQLTKNLACEWAKDSIRVNCKEFG